MTRKVIHKFYYHIDNGGINMEVFDSEPDGESCFPWVEFSESFFGYATGSVTVHNQGPDFLRKLGEAYLVAAEKLEVYSKEKESTAGERYAKKKQEKEKETFKALAEKYGYDIKRKSSDEDHK